MHALQIQNDFTWNNEDNAKFYEHITLNEFKDFALSSQIGNKTDIHLLKDHLLKATSILEVNAGYGRVIEGLIEIGFKNSITAIERNPLFCHQLRDRFGHQCEIIQSDVLSYSFKNKYDLILLMWSSITEFNPLEQKILISKLTSLLTQKGMIVIDLIKSSNELGHVTSIQGQQITVDHNGEREYFYLPSEQELFDWTSQTKLTLKHEIEYSISSKIQRKSYFFGLL